MTLTVVGSVAFATALQPMADKINATLGARVQDAVVVGKPGESMPRRSDGGPSFGWWKPKQRQIWLWDDIEEYPAVKTLVHEAMHMLDDDWFDKAQRTKIIKCIVPEPRSWGDDFIDGKRIKYRAEPYECFAVYGGAALFGLEKPAYAGLYVRRVPRGEWPLLAELALKDFGTPEPPTVPPEPIPTPPDPAAERIAELERALKAIQVIAKEKVEA